MTYLRGKYQPKNKKNDLKNSLENLHAKDKMCNFTLK